MIGTEIVVLLAFISRFSLDRKLTDLKDEISQKQELIEANTETTVYFEQLQQLFTGIKDLLTTQTKPLDILDYISRSLPPDVFIQSMEYNKGQIRIVATAGTTTGFSQFIANLSASPDLTNLELGDIKKSADSGIGFSLNVTQAGLKPVAKKP